MADHAALARDGADVADVAVAHVAQDDTVGAADVDFSTDSAILRQFRPYGRFYSHPLPVEVVDGVPVLTYEDVYDI